MNSPENGEFRSSLEIEKTRRPLWYGLVARIEDGRSESHFYVNAGGPSEAIQLAQQTYSEQTLTGPYEIYVFDHELRKDLDWKFGCQRQAVNTLRILMPEPEKQGSK